MEWGFLGGTRGEASACNAGGMRRSFHPCVAKIPLEEGMTTRSRIRAWRIPRTEEPGGLQSVRSQRVGHD